MHRREKERNKYRASNFFFPGNVGKNSCTCFCQKIIHNLPKDEKKFHAPENSHPPSPPLSKINGLSLARSYAAEYALASQQRDANTVLSCMAKCVISTLLLSVTINAR